MLQQQHQADAPDATNAAPHTRASCLTLHDSSAQKPLVSLQAVHQQCQWIALLQAKDALQKWQTVSADSTASTAGLSLHSNDVTGPAHSPAPQQR